MRLITEQIENSIQFYMYFSSYVPFEAFIKHQLEVKKFWKLSDCEVDSFQVAYDRHLKSNFNSKIFYSKEIKEIIYDKNSNIRPLDYIIYDELLSFTKKFLEILNSLFEEIHENANIIKKGSYSKYIKDLAELDKHDAKVSFIEFKKPFLKMTFDTSYEVKKYIFRVIDNIEYENEASTKKTVVHEELFACSNNTFEYNLLMRKWKEANSNKETSEISIKFSKVEVVNLTEFINFS